jgi:hypothetical protein
LRPSTFWNLIVGCFIVVLFLFLFLFCVDVFNLYTLYPVSFIFMLWLSLLWWTTAYFVQTRLNSRTFWFGVDACSESLWVHNLIMLWLFYGSSPVRTGEKPALTIFCPSILLTSAEIDRLKGCGAVGPAFVLWIVG